MLICSKCAAYYPEGAATRPICGHGASALPTPNRDDINPDRMRTTPPPEPDDESPLSPAPAMNMTLGTDSPAAKRARTIGFAFGASVGVFIAALTIADVLFHTAGSFATGLMNAFFAVLIAPIGCGVFAMILSGLCVFVLQALGRSVRNMLDPRVRAALRKANASEEPYTHDAEGDVEVDQGIVSSASPANARAMDQPPTHLRPEERQQ
jgi:hypothetical protein